MRLRIVIAACALASCGAPMRFDDPSVTPPTASANPPSRPPPSIDDVIATIGRVRGLRPLEPVGVTYMTHDEYVESRRESEPDSMALARDAFWQAFTFATPDVDVSTMMRISIATRTAGYYDLRKKKIVVVRAAAETMTQFESYALAHELQHALQDQNFGEKLKASKPDGADAALARRALLEGDADVTAFLYRLTTVDHDEHALERALLHVRTDAPRSLAGGSAPVNAPALFRRIFEFPYRAGFDLVGRVYRAGGVVLLDKMFEHPPVSTEQVLQPDKYIAGEMPVKVETPVTPDGYKSLSSGIFGDLVTRALLEQCGPVRASDQSPIGWGGDAFRVVEGSSGRLGILWSTVWDDEASARSFEAQMRDRGACLQKRVGEDGRARVGIDVAVAREGDRVVYVQGLGAEIRESTLRALLAVPVVRLAPQPPLGDVRLTRIVDPQRELLHHGTLSDGKLTSAPLGLTIATPRYFDEAATPSDAELRLVRKSDVVRVGLSVFALMSSSTPSHERDSLAAAMKNRPAAMIYKGDETIDVSAGRAHVHTWSMTGGATTKIAFLPMCGGRGTLMFIAVYAGAGAWSAIESVIDSVRLDDGSEACVYLATP